MGRALQPLPAYHRISLVLVLNLFSHPCCVQMKTAVNPDSLL